MNFERKYLRNGQDGSFGRYFIYIKKKKLPTKGEKRNSWQVNVFLLFDIFQFTAFLNYIFGRTLPYNDIPHLW